jgi:hypothetical protein
LGVVYDRDGLILDRAEELKLMGIL